MATNMSKSPGHVDVQTPACPVCKESVTIVVPQSGYIAWKRGTLLQNALPLLSDDDRERLKTGLHGKCWTQFLGVDPDAEPTDEELDALAAQVPGGPGPEDKDQDEDPADNPEPKVLVPTISDDLDDCTHTHLSIEGICHRCGEDRRGI